MTDLSNAIRSLASNTFASLIYILPLEGQVEQPYEMSDLLKQKKETLSSFIDQLLDPSKILPFEMPVKINASLRPYQQEG
eukprot:CAMPEP_0174266928 /NCGR_PEP_ID=MMETSP0439-20130205/31914_1 /TAXON_ID=0 /ORGANISM="Stereomyxa ramosa, Strain Chinc5" /LENGTH=79 /DNA_ID=CAMNT_0015354181 /DNA_START=182 /DNA_END=417 /DNA_ORIENTATION=+